MRVPGQAFLRPGDIAVHDGTGPGILRAVRNAADDRARVVVDLEGILLDATAASGRAPQRNVPCRVALRGGIVFAANGQRARGEPLARIMAG